MSDLIDVAMAAKRLGVSREFVNTMIDKGRLTLLPDKRLSLTEVDKLAVLVAKLREQGIATMVSAAGDELDEPE
ncbi:MAG TPA: hypothetical protein VIC08_02525 [Cellvibrionaceae bacterium]